MIENPASNHNFFFIKNKIITIFLFLKMLRREYLYDRTVVQDRIAATMSCIELSMEYRLSTYLCYSL